MNPAQRALHARLRELVDETPKSGALNAAKQPYHATRFAQAVERRAEDGPALVEYVRKKVHEPTTGGYDALVSADRADLTVESAVAVSNAPWSSEFTDADRQAARARLGTMLEAERAKRAAHEAEAVEHDRKIVAMMDARRAAAGDPPLSDKQQAEIMARLASKRANDT